MSFSGGVFFNTFNARFVVCPILHDGETETVDRRNSKRASFYNKIGNVRIVKISHVRITPGKPGRTRKKIHASNCNNFARKQVDRVLSCIVDGIVLQIVVSDQLDRRHPSRGVTFFSNRLSTEVVRLLGRDEK